MRRAPTLDRSVAPLLGPETELGVPISPGGLQVGDLTVADTALIEQVAAFLPACFERYRYLQAPGEARAEVLRLLEAPRMSLVVLDEAKAAVGWCGGIPEYDGRVWELHLMAVRPDAQRLGVGRSLLAHFEARVRQRGGLTVTLTTDDVDGSTSAFGIDPYPEIWRRIRDLRATDGHPLAFYRCWGYVVHGLIPDANGWGRPGILMAKRVAHRASSAQAARK
jgi:aminoglycoside 6'-N-acetyltransferase I